CPSNTNTSAQHPTADSLRKGCALAPRIPLLSFITLLSYDLEHVLAAISAFLSDLRASGLSSSRIFLSLARNPPSAPEQLQCCATLLPEAHPTHLFPMTKTLLPIKDVAKKLEIPNHYVEQTSSYGAKIR